MRLDTLAPGARFALAILPEQRGELLRVSAGAAVVRWDGLIEVERQGQHYTRRWAPLSISRGTEVVPVKARS